DLECRFGRDVHERKRVDAWRLDEVEALAHRRPEGADAKSDGVYDVCDREGANEHAAAAGPARTHLSVRNPSTVRREAALRIDGGRHSSDRRHLSVMKRQILQDEAAPVGFAVEEQRIAIRRPRFRNVALSLLRSGQTLGRPAAVRPLPEDGLVAFAIRLKGDPSAVSGPDWKSIPAAHR